MTVDINCIFPINQGTERETFCLLFIFDCKHLRRSQKWEKGYRSL